MSKLAPTHQKLRGGYYTPQPIADFLAWWAIKSPSDSVLEPSCGDGVLVESAIKVLIERGADRQEAVSLVQGVEIEQAERLKVLERIRTLGCHPKAANIHLGDFFTYCKENLAAPGLLALCDQREAASFDAIIGNPPFIRYQNFQEEHRQPAFEIMQRAGLSPNRLTNSWVPFVVAASFLLSEQGRLALVIPAELLQVNYAAELRRFLKLVLNQAKATCTDTIHRVRFREKTNGKLVVAAFLNSLTFAFSEVTGRSYGGGVLELEPNEAERLPLPLKNAERLDLDSIHEMLLSERISDALKITDKILLVDGLGLSQGEAKLLREIWQKLRDRRINRKHSIKRLSAAPDEESPTIRLVAAD